MGPLLCKGSTEKHTHHVPQDKPPPAQHLLPSPEEGRAEGAAQEEEGPASAGHSSKQACQSPKEGGTWRTGHVQPEREHGGGGPKGKSQKESHFVRKPNSQPPEATGHAPTPSACYRSSSKRLSETKSLESGSRDFRRERGPASRSCGQRPSGWVQSCVWATPCRFCFCRT